MTVELMKRMFDACYQAKRIREMLPALPEGVIPSYIHYLDVIEIMEKQGLQVKISDISDTLQLPRPGVTRTVKEMEKKGYLRKIASCDDGRVTYVSSTEKGKQLSRKYNEETFHKILPYMGEITEEDAGGMVRTIEKFYSIMSERRNYFDK